LNNTKLQTTKMDQLAHSASKKLAAAGREIRYFEYRLKKKAQQKQTGKPGAASSSSSKSPKPGSTEMEAARPQTMNEEDLQLQLALEMSKAEADKSTTDTVKEDLRLKMAIQESLKEGGSPKKPEQKSSSSNKQQKAAVASSGLLDLGDPWSIGNNSQPNNQNIAQTNGQQQHNGQASQAQDPFASAPNSSDPWGLGVPTTSKSTTNSVNATTNNADPWGAAPQAAPVQTVQNPTNGFSTDPWGNSDQNQVQHQQQPVQQVQQTTDFDPWGNATTTQNHASPTNPQQTVIDPFDMNSMFSATPTAGVSSGDNKPVEKNLAKNFLGDIGANLVNLDSLSFTAQTQQLQPTSTNLQPSVPLHNNNSTKSASPNVFDMNLNSTNPFSSSVVHSTGNVFSTQQATNNPFAAPPAHMGPTLNQLKAKAAPVADFPIADFSNGGFLQPTQVAAPNNSSINPFQ